MESFPLRIRLFGGFDLRPAGATAHPVDSARVQSLLAYLLLHREAPQPRQRLAYRLWPETTDSQARTNLRHLLHTTRRTLGPFAAALDVTSQTLQWSANAAVWLDVAEFESALTWADQDPAAEVEALGAAVALYTGDLLDGCDDEWVLEERVRLRERFLGALDRLSTALETAGDLDGAIDHAQRLLHDDPLREEIYRRLMRLHAARGDRARALRVFHLCAATLERELNIEPSAETRATYEALLPDAGNRPSASLDSGRAGDRAFVGRVDELARLTMLWRASERGRTQLVLVVGEAGIGKSRLIEEFRLWCNHRGAVAVETRAYPAEGALAYGPVVTWLRSAAIRPLLERLDGAQLSELARIVPELLVQVPGIVRPDPLPERELRRRLFDAIAHALLVSGTPLLLILDDVHWAEPETLRLLHYLLRAEPGARLLIAATARREEIEPDHPLNELIAGAHALERCAEIQIERLSRAETAMLAERTIGRRVSRDEAERLIAETEGNPLFVIEALRAGWSDGTLDHHPISPRVQAAIEARLTQLSRPARDLADQAAAIGRAFTTDLLASACDIESDTFVRGLDELWRRGIVRERGVDAYDFSHDKIREVAYLGLSPIQRRQAHLRVARALEQLHRDELTAVSGHLAAHYDRAGAVDRAIVWYERAATAARALYANTEVIRCLDRALTLLRTLPATPERSHHELDLLAAELIPLGWVDGWASPALAAAQQRSLDLAREIGVEPASPLLRSLAMATLSRRDFGGTREVGERLRARGERDADDMLRVEADYVLGIAAFWSGHFEAARIHFTAAIDRSGPHHRHQHLVRYGMDPKVICLSRLGNTFWFLGRPAAAVDARDAALSLAGQIGHPPSHSTALVFAVLLSIELRDWTGVRSYAAALVAARDDDDTTRPTRVSTEAISGYVDVLSGQHDRGIARLRGMLREARDADQAPGVRAVLHRLLLESCAMAGMTREGLAAADQVLAWTEEDRLWEAETRRLRATFLAALRAPAAAVETEFERAIAVARRQGATMLELRSLVSSLRYRRDHGDDAGERETRERMLAVVARLPDERDTPDLLEARRLLG